MSTFQQDTTRRGNILEQQTESSGSGLQLNNSQTAIKPIPERKAPAPQPDTEVQPEKKPGPPTAAQLRYWWWQKEQKLVVGDSRYIEPKNEITVQSETKIEDKGLALPNREKNTSNTDWLTILLIVVLVLFASVRTSYSKYLGSLFHSIFNYSTSQRMYQEKNYSFLHAAFRLEVYFYLTFSVFLYQVFQFFDTSLAYRNIGLFLFSLGLVLVYFIGKKTIYKIVGFLVEGTNETSEYLFNLDNVNRVMGIALFPVIALIAFYPSENRVLPLVIGIISVAFLYFCCHWSTALFA